MTKQPPKKNKPYQWPLISLGAAIALTGLLWIAFSHLDPRIYLLVGVITFLVTLAFNPALRYYRAFALVMGLIGTHQIIGFKISGEIEGQEYLIYTPEFTTGVLIALIALAALALALDFLERNGQGVPALSLRLHLERNKDIVKGDKIIQGDSIQGKGKKEVYVAKDGGIIYNNSTVHLPSNQAPKIRKDLTDFIPRRALSTTIGRNSKLKDLRQMLLQGQRVAVVNGIGGIGKTTLAEVYLEEYYDQYHHVAWITQKNQDFRVDLIRQDYLIERLGIDVTGLDTEMLFARVIHGLKSIDARPNLIIIDNAIRSLETLLPFLPKGPNWHILATTREEFTEVPMLRLDSLGPDDAKQLFRKFCPINYEESRLEALLNKIEYHTLTVELLSKTANDRRLSIEKMMSAIINDQEAQVYTQHNRKTKPVVRIGTYLSRVFALIELTEAERWMLKYWACLPSIFITYSNLVELIQPEDGKQETFAQSLNELVRKGLLLRDYETDAYKVHTLISDIAWKDLAILEEDVVQLITKLSENLRIDQINGNLVETFFWKPFGNKIINRFKTIQSRPLAYVYSNLALVLNSFGETEQAKDLLLGLKESDERLLGFDHLSLGTTYSNLGIVLHKLGQFSEAKELTEKGIKIAEKEFREEDNKIYTRYSNYAIILSSLGNNDSARIYLEKTMAADEENLGEYHPKTSITYSNLGMVLGELGEYEKAKYYLKKALDSDEKNFGQNHTSTAVSYSNLAWILEKLEDFNGARKLLEKAVVANEENYGPGHSFTLETYDYLANVLRLLKDYDSEKKILEKTVFLTKKKYGKEHPRTAIKESKLGLLLKFLGDFEGAKPFLEKALRSAEINFGTDHPTTASRYSNLGSLLKDMRDFGGAESLFNESLKIMENHFGNESDKALTVLSNLAQVYVKSGYYLKAKPILEKLARKAEIAHGISHPITALRYSNLGTLLADLGFHGRAIELYELAILSAENHLGKEHPTTGRRYSNLAISCIELDQYSRAENLLRGALRIFEIHFPEGHFRIKNVKNLLASLPNHPPY